MSIKNLAPNSENGSVTIELILVLPILILILMVIADFGRLIHDKLVVVGAANAAARYGSFNTTNYANNAGIINAALQSGVDIALINSDISITSRQCYCITNGGLSLALMGSCSDSCSGSGVDPSPAKFLTVTVTHAFVPMFIWPITIDPVSSSATMRVQ
jgi:hypothetical protein